jgi:hypothetical protein
MFAACGLYFLAVIVFHIWFRKAETAYDRMEMV